MVPADIDTTQACRIVDLLKSNGFSDNDVSVLLSDKQGTRDFAHEKHTKAPEGAAVGAASGSLRPGLSARIAECDQIQILRDNKPFFLAILGFLVVLMLVPGLATWLPSVAAR